MISINYKILLRSWDSSLTAQITSFYFKMVKRLCFGEVIKQFFLFGHILSGNFLRAYIDSKTGGQAGFLEKSALLPTPILPLRCWAKKRNLFLFVEYTILIFQNGVEMLI